MQLCVMIYTVSAQTISKYNSVHQQHTVLVLFWAIGESSLELIEYSILVISTDIVSHRLVFQV